MSSPAVVYPNPNGEGLPIRQPVDPETGGEPKPLPTTISPPAEAYQKDLAPGTTGLDKSPTPEQKQKQRVYNVVQDPDFKTLKPEEQRDVLAHYDNDFGSLELSQVPDMVSHLQSRAKAYRPDTNVHHPANPEMHQAVSPTEIGKGAAQETWDLVKGMAIHTGLVGAAQDAYDEVFNQVPPIYKAYEDAKAEGKSTMEAVEAASAEAKRQEEAHDALKQRLQEYKEHPNKAAGRAIVDLVGVVLGAKYGPKVGAPPEGEVIPPGVEPESIPSPAAREQFPIRAKTNAAINKSFSELTDAESPSGPKASARMRDLSRELGELEPPVKPVKPAPGSPREPGYPGELQQYNVQREIYEMQMQYKQLIDTMPDSEQGYLRRLIEPNTKAKGSMLGRNRIGTDWEKTLEDFDKLGPEKQMEQFSNPKYVRDILVKKAGWQRAVHHVTHWGSAGIVGGGGLYIGEEALRKIIKSVDE